MTRKATMIVVILLSVSLLALFQDKGSRIPRVYASSNSAYFPSSNSTSSLLVAGNVATLAALDGSYEQLRSVAGATAAIPIYSNQTTTSVNGGVYYTLSQAKAAQAGTTFSCDMSFAGRVNYAKLVYPLTGVNTISTSTWTMHYRTYQDANQSVAKSSTANAVQTTAYNNISWLQTNTAGTYNGLLIVVVTGYNTSSGTLPTCTGCTYNGVAMTQQVTATYNTPGSNANLTSYLFTYVNPPIGSAYTVNATARANTIVWPSKIPAR